MFWNELKKLREKNFDLEDRLKSVNDLANYWYKELIKSENQVLDLGGTPFRTQVGTFFVLPPVYGATNYTGSRKE